MAGRIPDETLDAIRERVSIVEVVSGYVTLKKAGRNYLGLCPFHGERTPSFTVSDERGLFHCFGCGVGGTVFTFVMRLEGLTFVEAVETLARRAGVTLPERSGGEADSARRQLLELNEMAQQYFRASLAGATGAVARAYLERRGLSPATADRYGLGFCPPTGSGLARTLRAQGKALQRAAEVGLVGTRGDGTAYDRMWGRVTFPIRDGSGHILGFGARTLGTEQPKYLNSPESPVFHKGRVLYGLYEAREAVRAAGKVVIVEGYLDALALVEAGIGHVAASLGTALTPAQLRLARRFAPEIVAFFDGDRAGAEAAVRAFAVCAEVGVWGLGAFLPDGEDPDSFVRRQGPAPTLALLEQAIPLADFFLQRVDPGPSASMPARAAAIQRVLEVIGRIEDPVQFSLLAQRAAQRLGVDESVLRDARSATRGRSAPTVPPSTPVAPAELRPEEVTLLEAMALDRDAARMVAEAGVLDVLQSAELARAGREILAACARDEAAAAVIDRLPNPLADRVAAALLGEGPVAGADRLQIARDCVAKITARERRTQAVALRASLRAAESSGDDADLQAQLRRANELLRGKS